MAESHWEASLLSHLRPHTPFPPGSSSGIRYRSPHCQEIIAAKPQMVLDLLNHAFILIPLIQSHCHGDLPHLPSHFTNTDGSQ